MQQTAAIKNMRIGDILKDYGYVTDDQIQAALDYQKQHKGERLGSVLIKLGAITEEQMLQALAKRLGFRRVDVAEADVGMEAVRLLPRHLAERYCILPIRLQDNILTVVVNDPLDFYALEDVRQVTGMHLDILLCERVGLEKAIRYYYTEADAHRAAQAANISIEPADVRQLAALDDAEDDAPIIELLSSLIRRAYATTASDIHIEPFEDKTLVRMRIDGTISEYVTLQKSLHSSLIARIKILSDLDIAEKRVPQDGHFRMTLSEAAVNIRVSIIPTVFGEKAVLRLLAGNTHIDHARTYGMRPGDAEKLDHMLRSPHGIIYFTGPTGSGKTTTLYMILDELAGRNVNISTIEDPVEKNLSRINQMQVNNTAGLTFEAGLRALLRQDPDIIMVGEIRDRETASIATRAAITGHLVFSTLHTNDAVSSIIRLEDMGLEPYMVSGSLVGIVAQRLMRKLCPECAVSGAPTAEEAALLGPGVARVKRPVGCKHCNYTGYRGRIAIHEILTADQTVRGMITAGAPMDQIKTYCVEQQGMHTLRESGLRLLGEGVTSVEEFIKVSYYAD